MPIITKEQFLALYDLSKVGNPEQDFQDVCNLLERKIFTFKGEFVDYDFLFNKYKAYLAWWERKFGKTEEKYLAKKNAKKSIGEFSFGEMYNMDYETLTERDEYLFGDKSDKFYKKKLEEFKENINKK